MLWESWWKESKLCSKRFDDQYSDRTISIIADHLITHGVTVQEWIPVTEKLPDDWVDVLARLQCGDCVVAVKSGPIWRERFTNIRLEGRDISHWMPLPDPPEKAINQDHNQGKENDYGNQSE